MNTSYLIEFQVKAEQRERFHALLGAVLDAHKQIPYWLVYQLGRESAGPEAGHY